MRLVLSTSFALLVISNAIPTTHSPSSRDLHSPFNIPWPQNDAWLEGHPWIPSALVRNASRSPCPMLNTMANHGFLARDGRNITKDDLNKAQVTALNMSPDFASTTTNAMVAKLGSPKNASAAFDLEDFASHDHTEHDASLTRLDTLQGSNIDVNPGLVLKLLNDSSLPWLNTSSIGRSRARREAESKAIGSPALSDAFTHFAQLEASFILVVFGVGGDQNSADNIGAPRNRLKEWLNEERFPIDEGWQKSETVLTTDLQKAVIAGIQKYHDEFVGDY